MAEIESLNKNLQNGDSVGWIYENHGPSNNYAWILTRNNKFKKDTEWIFKLCFGKIEHLELLEEQIDTTNLLKSHINQIHQKFDEQIHTLFQKEDEKDVQTKFESEIEKKLCKQWHPLQMKIYMEMKDIATHFEEIFLSTPFKRYYNISFKRVCSGSNLEGCTWGIDMDM